MSFNFGPVRLGIALLIGGAIALTACGREDTQTAIPETPSTAESPQSSDSGDVASSESAASNTPDAAASEATSDASPAAAIPADSVNIGRFGADELFAAGGGGCGMSLKPVDTSWQDGIIFFHGLENDSAFMVIDDTMVELTRTAAKGEAFYGQQTEQTFANGERSLLVEVAVTLGEPGEIESINIPEGLMIINQAGAEVEIPVEGDAGC